jgi:hypothetical protein
MPKCLTAIIFTAIYLFGCTISDEDRCPDGLEWNGDIQVCQEIQELPDGGTGDASAGGYLEPCEGNEDCASYEADYCLYNPMGDDPGICLLQDCTAGSCPEDSLCCDCSGMMAPFICLPEQVAEDPEIEKYCDCML